MRDACVRRIRKNWRREVNACGWWESFVFIYHGGMLKMVSEVEKLRSNSTTCFRGIF
jgi:hypothetical protein